MWKGKGGGFQDPGVVPDEGMKDSAEKWELAMGEVEGGRHSRALGENTCSRPWGEE